MLDTSLKLYATIPTHMSDYVVKVTEKILLKFLMAKCYSGE